MDWLHQCPDHQTKSYKTQKLLVLNQKLAGYLKEVALIVPDSARFSLCLPKRTESIVFWPTSFQFPPISGLESHIEPAVLHQPRRGKVL